MQPSIDAKLGGSDCLLCALLWQAGAHSRVRCVAFSCAAAWVGGISPESLLCNHWVCCSAGSVVAHLLHRHAPLIGQ